MEMFKRIVREEEGQDLIEYSLIAGLIAVVCFTAIQATGTSISGLWTALSTAVAGVTAGVTGAA